MRALGLLMTGLIVAAIALLGTRSIEWFILKQSLRHRFPKVEWITTAQLADWLADKATAAAGACSTCEQRRNGT